MSQKNRKSYSKSEWLKVESAYRGGILSLRQISIAYGPSAEAIRKKAKLLNWQRISKQEIKKKREQLLSVASQIEPRSVDRKVDSAERGQGQNSNPDPRYQEAIQLAAYLQAQIIQEHRSMIREARSLLEEMLAVMQIKFRLSDELKGLYHEVIIGGRENDGKPCQADLIKFFGLEVDTEILLKLARSLEKLINLERQTFGMKDNKENALCETYEEQLRKVIEEYEQHLDADGRDINRQAA